MITKKQIKEEIDACIENVKKELSQSGVRDWDRNWDKIIHNVGRIIEWQAIYYH